MSAYILEMKNITKTFPGVIALNNVSLQVKRGEIHALVGENGAGKSTLMKVLNGVYQADSGEILIDGQTVKIREHDRRRAARDRPRVSGVQSGQFTFCCRKHVPEQAEWRQGTCKLEADQRDYAGISGLALL